MKVKIVSEVVSTKLDNEITLLNMNTGKYFSFNEIGSRIWELLNKLGDTETVLEILMDEYDAGKSVLINDIELLLRQLTEAGLIITE